MTAPLILAFIAIAVPVRLTAEWLSSNAVAATDLRPGVWILKGALLATAGLALIIGRLETRERVTASPSPARGGYSRTFSLVLVGLLALGAALRLYALNTELWLDEIDTLVRYARLPLQELLGTYDSQNQHPLYLLLAKLSFAAFGGTEWSIRLPAVAFGVASLWATWAFARRVTAPAEALLAVLVLTLSYHHVWFSQNARGYTAMLFFALITTPPFVRLASAEEPRPARAAWLYAILMAAAAYTHLTAVLVAVGHAAAWAFTVPWRSLAERRQRLVWPAVALVLSATLTVMLYSLILPQVARELLTPTLTRATVEWTSPWWLVTETLRVLGAGVPGGLITVSVAVGVLAIGVGSYWRQSRLLALAMFAPIVITGVAAVAMRHNLWPRFFFFAAAFLVLAALRGGFVVVRRALGSRGEPVAIAGAAVMATLSVVLLPRAWQPKQQYLAAARFVQEQRAPGDGVIALGIAASVYGMRGAPSDWHLAPSVDDIAAIERSSRRTWVIYTFPVHLRALHSDLAQRVTLPPYREVRVFPATVGGGEMRVLLNDSGVSHD